MLNYTNCVLQRVAVHHIGNITDGGDVLLSKELLDTSDNRLRELLFTFFLTPFTSSEYFNFTFSNKDFNLNPLYKYATRIFEDPRALLLNSIDIAKHLFECSIHPQIKPGDLFISYFTNITVGDVITDAIGIFKSETRQPFLTVNATNDRFIINHDEGINVDKLDKGCLVFNTDAEKGLKVCIVDKAGKNIEAQYWKDSFLQLAPCNDNFHHTKEFMNIARSFVTQQFPEDFEVSRADQIDLLNRSVDYFKSNDNFNKTNFENNVLHDEGVIKSFRNFDTSYRRQMELELPDDFEVSSDAVKKQSRVFKSVLKLDKNFHIYIHGNRELIEKGSDSNGRKYYKIYFNEES